MVWNLPQQYFRSGVSIVETLSDMPNCSNQFHVWCAYLISKIERQHNWFSHTHTHTHMHIHTHTHTHRTPLKKTWVGYFKKSTRSRKARWSLKLFVTVWWSPWNSPVCVCVCVFWCVRFFFVFVFVCVLCVWVCVCVIMLCVFMVCVRVCVSLCECVFICVVGWLWVYDVF